MEPLDQTFPDRLVEGGTDVIPDMLPHQVPKGIVVQVQAIQSEYREAVRQQTGIAEMEQGRDQFALGQISPGTKDNHGVRQRRRGLGIVGLRQGHKTSPQFCCSPWPPNW